MELKYKDAGMWSFKITGSNRTFMELKFGVAEDVVRAGMVLIVPLWN